MSALPTAALLATLQSAESFTHHIAPPTVAGGEHANQRRYGPNAYYGTRPKAARNETIAPQAGVYRDSTEDTAELTLTLGLHNSAHITIQLSPAELRELAGRLLDAAADIEANPAAVLTKRGAA